jgi:hypothetical protein
MKIIRVPKPQPTSEGVRPLPPPKEPNDYYRSERSAQYLISVLKRWDELGRNAMWLEPNYIGKSRKTFMHMVYGGASYIRNKMPHGPERDRLLDLYNACSFKNVGNRIRMTLSTRASYNVDTLLKPVVEGDDEMAEVNPISYLHDWLAKDHKPGEVLEHRGRLNMEEITYLRKLLARDEYKTAYLNDITNKGYRIIRFDIE